MKGRTSRIKLIYDLARAEERKFCAAMGSSQKTLAAEVDRLRELESYRRSYAQKLESADTVSAARWQDYQNFLQRIDKAVDGQKLQIQSNRKTCDVYRKRWLVERRKLESLQRVLDRYRKSEALESERREQKQLDELVVTNRFAKDRASD